MLLAQLMAVAQQGAFHVKGRAPRSHRASIRVARSLLDLSHALRQIADFLDILGERHCMLRAGKCEPGMLTCRV